MTVARGLATFVLILAAARSGQSEAVPSEGQGGKAGTMTVDEAMLKRIAAAAPDDAKRIRRFSTEMMVEALPFYRQHKWVRLTIIGLNHPSGLDYADDGRRIILLSADPETVYAVNRAEQLELNDDQVIPYVVFFLTVTGDKGSMYVAELSDVPWLPGTEKDEELRARREAVSNKLHPAQVSKVADGYRVSIQMVLMQELIELSLAVSRDGHVRTIETRSLDQGLPVHSFE